MGCFLSPTGSGKGGEGIWLAMQRPSLGSVKAFYPRWTRDELIALLRARLPELARSLPFWRVGLSFGPRASIQRV